MRFRSGTVGLGTAVFVALVSPSRFACAQIVTLTATDAVNTSSFNTAGHWSNGLAPAAGSTYLVPNGLTLRTPATGTNYTFAGDSLTLGGGGAVSTMNFKSPASGTITIENLTLNNGTVANSNGNTFTLAGNGVTLLSGGGTVDTGAVGRIVTVDETITGVGALTIANSTANGQATANLTEADSYTGGTTVNNLALLDVDAAGALGTGSVTVSNGGTMTLTGGTTNQYIASTASLIVGTAGLVNLTFTGTDSITSLSLNGGSSFFNSGTYGSLTSTAQNKSSLFTGNGILSLTGASATPEPDSFWLATIAGLLPAGISLRRRSRAADHVIRR